MDPQPDGLQLVPDEPAAVADPRPSAPSSAESARSATPPAPPAVDRSRPKKTLPTNRMAFPKQLETLRGWAIAGAGGRVATNQQVAEIVGLKADTVTLANTFFADVKFLTKADGGYAPTDVTLAFNDAHAWNPDTAAHKLAPALKDSWFGQALLPVVQLRPISITEALAKLAEAAGARTEHRAQLSLVLDYLEAGGLIRNEGGQVRATTPDAAAAIAEAADRPADPAAARDHAPTKGQAAVATGFAQSPEGQLQFSINFRVTMSEIAGWQPERISAFFAGVAQVLAAKADVERRAGSG